MSRLQAIDPATAEGKTKALFDGVQKKLGVVPNLLRTLGASPAALEAYLAFSQALGGAGLDSRTRESIALTVAGENACDYCASAHTAIGGSLGIGAAELADNLRGRSGDAKLAAALDFAAAVTRKRGLVGDDDLAALRQAGYDDAAAVEIVTTVALNLLTNYVNHVAQTDIDFPKVTADAAETAA
ncbi:carboxymuconolactone decarboxylase family protein [Pelagibius litoralis]|uniref:Carboxymuconolactone decarboxylase family protein n=1 Tax=Pelagibius litoralis TaxID=374515 RepID=A0A967KEI7_9PROT|nr:carboxymuconolactone decarboxylase family protein [Pelagibius litoralis]NIA71954.1 carboxymuconolactone decarboxylase family protein [Pelagibius litoralis]